MVADLAELHEHVEQLDAVRPAEALRECASLERILVYQSALHFGHADVELDLDLRRQVLLHVLLDAPQHERSQDRMQLAHDVVLGS